MGMPLATASRRFNKSGVLSSGQKPINSRLVIVPLIGSIVAVPPVVTPSVAKSMSSIFTSVSGLRRSMRASASVETSPGAAQPAAGNNIKIRLDSARSGPCAESQAK